MNAIPSPCLEFFNCTGQRVGFCPNGPAIARHDTAFLAHHTALGRGFALTVTFQNKPLRPIYSAAAPTNAETEQVETILSEQYETVRVRFKLQKECAFGQEYMIVGDDEVLGSWNPSGGVSLTWSEGHMWTTELDLPVDKMIKYKFVLKCVVGAISWQPGPDRVLKTWKTEKMISVSEDWGNPGLQNIVEDEPAADPIETDSESSIIADNSISTESIEKTPKANDDAKNQVKHSAKKVTKRAQKETLSSNDNVSSPVSQADSEKQEMSLGDSGSAEKVENDSISSEDGTTLDEDEDEEAAVLVLGLAPEEEIGEAELNKAASSSIDSEDLAKPELNTECATASAPLHSSGINGDVINDEKLQLNDKQQLGEMRIDEEQQQPENILETDAQWGKQTLYKLLSIFGLQ